MPIDDYIPHAMIVAKNNCHLVLTGDNCQVNFTQKTPLFWWGIASTPSTVPNCSQPCVVDLKKTYKPKPIWFLTIMYSL